ncbi:cytochrome P450 [Actinomadura kijaniata]|uniref:cytochrome P450 n=1 Tax=Actinomadura kijaniata TaxID=46161 RepID=UPI00082E7740|nr:cytochrome P450 [Actinomadura kijaniata]
MTAPAKTLMSYPDPTPLAAVTADPATVLVRLWREHGPLAPVLLEPDVPAWLVMGYRQLGVITRDESRFTRNAAHWRLYEDGTVPSDSDLGPMMFPRANVIGVDGDEHRRLRQPLHDVIANVDHRWLRRTVQDICARQIATIAPTGQGDLVADYAAAVPLLTLGELIGLEPDQRPELLESMHLLFSSGPRAQEGNARFEALLTGLMDYRSPVMGADLVGALLNHPNLHNREEVLQTLVVLTTAGNHTLISWIAAALQLMLTDTRFYQSLSGGRRSVAEALHEVLARRPPMINMPARYALRDTELAGYSIARGDALILGLAGAAHDPSVHAPDWWLRQPHAHLAWSAGPHACPARDIAYTIAHTAVAAAHHHLPDLRLTIDADQITYLPSIWTAIPHTLPVTFTPHPHRLTTTHRTACGPASRDPAGGDRAGGDRAIAPPQRSAPCRR